MGGYGAWTLALKHPTRFAAIVAVCGAILPPGHFTQLDAGLREKDPYAELARRLGARRSGCFTAPEIPSCPEESRRIHKAFSQAGYKINYTEYPEVGHESWDPAFGDPMLWDWLFQQRRPARGGGGKHE